MIYFTWGNGGEIPCFFSQSQPVSRLGLLLKSLLPVGLPKDFPDAPDPKSLAPELGRLIANADAQAREHPTSAEDVGRLGMVYHANQLYDRAASAYRIASRIDPGDYRWFYYQALLEEENGLEKPQSALLRETVRLQLDFQPALVKLGDIHFKCRTIPARPLFTD